MLLCYWKILVSIDHKILIIALISSLNYMFSLVKILYLTVTEPFTVHTIFISYWIGQEEISVVGMHNYYLN